MEKKVSKGTGGKKKDTGPEQQRNYNTLKNCIYLLRDLASEHNQTFRKKKWVKQKTAGEIGVDLGAGAHQISLTHQGGKEKEEKYYEGLYTQK